MKYVDAPLTILERELAKRAGKEDKFDKNDMEELMAEIKSRQSYYDDLPDFLKTELGPFSPGGLLSGVGQGFTGEFGDDIADKLDGNVNAVIQKLNEDIPESGKFPKVEFAKYYRAYLDQMEKRYPIIHTVGKIGGMLGLSAVTSGAAATALPKLAGPAMEIAALKKAKDAAGLKKYFEAAGNTTKISQFLAEHGLAMTHDGAIAAVTGLGTGHDMETKLKDAAIMGLSAPLFSSTMSLAGKGASKLLKKIKGGELETVAKNLGVTTKEELTNFLAMFPEKVKDKDELLSILREKGITDKIKPDNPLGHIDNWISEIDDNANTIIDELNDNVLNKPGVINKLPSITKENIYDIYKQNSPSFGDEQKKIIDEVWSTIEPQWNKGEFKYLPDMFGVANKKLRKSYPFYLGKLDPKVTHVPGMLRNTGDYILEGGSKDLLKDISPELQTSLVEFGKKYVSNEGKAAKLHVLKNFVEELNRKKIAGEIVGTPLEESLISIPSLVKSTIGGLGGGLIGGPKGAALGALAVAGGKLAAKGVKKASPYIDEAIESAAAGQANKGLSFEVAKMLPDYMKTEEEKKEDKKAEEYIKEKEQQKETEAAVNEEDKLRELLYRE